MGRCSFIMVVALIAGLLQAQVPPAIDLAPDVRLLKQNGLPTEGPGLLQLFRERTLTKDQVADLENQAKLLSSSVFAERKKAEVTLLKAGPIARKLLLDLVKAKGTSLETIRRAEVIVRKIAEGQDTLFVFATARLIAHHKPPGSGQTLLDYVPFASDARILEEVQQGLNAVAIADGKVDPALLGALSDKHDGKRAAAGEAIVRGGGLGHKKVVEALLDDKSALVRLGVTLALVEAQDKRAVRGLIDLLADVPKDKVWQIEELLHRIAGDKAPEVWAGGKTSAKIVRTAWLAWWQTNQQTFSLSKLSEPPRYRGFVLVTAADKEAPKGKRGSQVMEVRPSKQVGLKYEFPRGLTDGQFLTKDRVLVAEGRKVSERDLDTNIYWEKECEEAVVACQRLPGGDTFIATGRRLLLVDPVGQTMFSHLENKDVKDIDEADPDELIRIIGAGRARDGHMVYVSDKGKCTWLDPEGFEVRTFQVAGVPQQIGTIDILPGHRIVLPLADKVAEFDKEGRIVWQAARPAVSALRLPNGNTLVASGPRVSEIDRTGLEVWHFNSKAGLASRLRRR